MYKLVGIVIVASIMMTVGAQALSYDANVTPDVIFGDGNDNGSWTVDQNNGIELGLRGKLRHNASGLPENTFNSNGDGTYSFAAIVGPGQSWPTAEWSLEWSINSDYLATSLASPLNSWFYELGLDSDPTAGTAFTTFDPINTLIADHALGDNSTGNGSGTKALNSTEYADFISFMNVAQNSWKAHWVLSGFDPTVDGEYDIYLTAFDQTGAQLARTDIRIIVGNGASGSVPDAGATMALMGVALLGLGVLKRQLS